MKTERLYYNDPYLLEFDANIVGTAPAGSGVGVLLDRTAFYPAAGGQPNDLGTIDGLPLVDCYEDEKTGDIIHVLETALTSIRVHGRVDAARRKDHMQQHSGQHVLSQAFVELFNWPTASFHLGAAACTIDLPVEGLTIGQIAEAEELANRIVQENRSVAIRYLSHEDIGEAGLRKPSERTGEIRVIEISGYDRSACGGTHVRFTAEIGPILITRVERAKKQIRVEFICGNRVLKYAREAGRTLEAISQTVSAPPLETAAAVRSIWDDLQRSRKRIEELEQMLLDGEAARFPIEDGLAVASFKNRGMETIKMLALKICSRPGAVALLADESDQLRVVFACSGDSAVDCSDLIRKVVARFGGRGGGRPKLAQAGGLNAGSAEPVLGYAAELVRGMF